MLGQGAGVCLILGGFFMKLYVFLVTLGCFASVFYVPSTWECSGGSYDSNGGCHKKMNDPASVGLCKCEVHADFFNESIVVKNLAGKTLSCLVHGWVVNDGDQIFSIDVDKHVFGTVWFSRVGRRCGNISVVDASERVIFSHDLLFCYPWSRAKRLQYEVGIESLTVRKFFCFDGELSGFVSATIYYNDLLNIVISCGRGGPLSFCDGHSGLALVEEFQIGALRGCADELSHEREAKEEDSYL